MAAGLSVGLCVSMGIVSLIVVGLTNGTPNALPGLFLGIFLRTIVPMLLSLLVVNFSPPLANAGLMGMVLIAFLLVLLFETYFSVRIVKLGQVKLGQSSPTME